VFARELHFTDGVFKDENIIFDRIAPEWQDFRHTTLGFESPNSRTENSS
jgi:hypothetical protein